jgi:2-polyprenyl-3-methyl-5-hydroxy-6-metoxy-1,4-benzoquinol methylase
LAEHVIINKCPLCSSSDIAKILDVTDYRVSTEQFSINECKNCSLRITSPMPNETKILKYYDSDSYISHSDEPRTLIDKTYKLVQTLTLRSKKRFVNKWSSVKLGSILDIGCGTGDFLNKMKLSGWKVDGVELESSAREKAQSRINKNIMTPKDFLNSKNQFDVITMWHSLEHLHNLSDYIEKIRGSFNNNGILIIAVPNYNSFDAEYYKSNWAAYDAPRHLYHFSFKAMQTLVEKSNLSIIHYKQLPFDPFYIAFLSEMLVKNSKNLLPAIWIGFRSYLTAIFNAKKSSSILYLIQNKYI